MKKLFTLVALMLFFMGAKAKSFVVVDAEVDFSEYTDISEVPFAEWRGSESAFARLSIQNGCLHFESTEATDPSWDCQFFPIGGVGAERGVTYTLHYKIKGDHSGNVSMLGFGQTPWGQFQITDEWVEGTVEYFATNNDGYILMQCGDWIGTWDIAYLKITHKEMTAEWENILLNGDASTKWDNPYLSSDDEGSENICAWSKEWGTLMNDINSDAGGVKQPVPHPAVIEDSVFVCHAKAVNPILRYAHDVNLGWAQYKKGDEMPDNTWQNQFWINFPRPLKGGERVWVSFRYKASEKVNVTTQVHQNNPGVWLGVGNVGNIEFDTEWRTFDRLIFATEGAHSLAFNLTGENENWKKDIDFYFDDLNISNFFYGDLNISVLELESSGGTDSNIKGDVNEDGTVDVADISSIIDIMASKARRQTEPEE